MIRRKLSAIVFGLLIAAILAGGAGTGTLAKTKVRFMMWGPPDPYQPVIAAFEKAHPDIEVVAEPGPDFGSYLTKLQAEFAAGLAPDVFKVSGAFLSYLARTGALLDLQPYLERSQVNLNNYLPTGDIFRYRGRIYGMGDAFDFVGLLYNQDLFDQAGLAVPNANWTWENLRQAAAKLTVRSGDEVRRYGTYIYVAPEYYGHASWMNFFAQNGVRPLNAEKNRAAFNTPAGVETVQFMTDFVQKDRSSPPIQQYFDSKWDFGQEKLAMDFSIFPNAFASLRQAAKFAWDVAPLPKGKQRAAVTNTVGFAINAQSRVKDAAWELLNFITTEGQKILAANQVILPVYKPAIPLFIRPNQRPYKLLEVLQESSAGLVDMQFTPTWNEWTAALGSQIADAVAGRKSAQAALAQAEEQVNKILAKEK